MSAKTRLWVYVPDSILKIINEETKGEADQSRSKSAWIVSACEQYLILRDQKPDQLTDPERVALQQRITTLEASLKECEQVRENLREDLQALRISSATLEERVKSQSMLMDELRARATQAEGLVQTLMAERQALLPQKTGFWSRLFGKG